MQIFRGKEAQRILSKIKSKEGVIPFERRHKKSTVLFGKTIKRAEFCQERPQKRAATLYLSGIIPESGFVYVINFIHLFVYLFSSYVYI